MQLFSTRLHLLTENQAATLSIYAMQLGLSLLSLMVFGATAPSLLASSRKNHKSPHVLVTLPKLRGITLSGASNGDIKDSFSFDQLDIELSGSSDLKISDLTAKLITLKASGASDTQLHGKAQILRAELSGASDLKAYGLTVEEAIIRVNGASDAFITVTKRLEKNVRGGADISYRGNPIVDDLKGSDDNSKLIKKRDM